MLYAVFAFAPALVFANRVQTDFAQELEVADFQHPDECLEICHATPKIFGKSSRRYKCILKDRTKIPPGCNDTSSKLKLRKHTPAQYKITCPFETPAIAKEALKQIPKQCSTHMKCCCNEADKLSVRVCLPLHITDDVTFHAPIIFPELARPFKRIEQTYTNYGKCVKVLEPLKYQLVEDGEFGDHDACCIETANSTSEEGVEFTTCAKFEQLYHCTRDDPSEQTGQFYQRITQGQCLGEKSPGDKKLVKAFGRGFKCPADYYTPTKEQACACHEDCR